MCQTGTVDSNAHVGEGFVGNRLVTAKIPENRDEKKTREECPNLEGTLTFIVLH